MIDDLVINLNEDDKESIVSRLSDELLMENLEEQLSSLILVNFNPTNFLSIFNERFTYLSEKYFDNPEVKDVLQEIKYDLYNRVRKGIEEKFDIASNLDPSFMAASNYFFHVKKLYEFFVIDYRRNLIQFFLNYILNNKPELVKTLKGKTNKKDLGVISLRKTLSKLDDVIIIYNIEDIVMDVVDTLDDGNFIIETIVSSDENEAINVVMHDLFIDSVQDSFLGAEFASRFFAPLKDDQFSFDILSDIKSSFLRISPKKTSES